MKFEITDEDPDAFAQGEVRLSIFTDLDTALQIIRDIV
jgi:hypothetical protein